MNPHREHDMQSVIRRRSGVALPMVLGSLVLIGVLIAGVMFASVQEFRIGANTTHQTRAATAAEFGLNRVLVDWNPASNTTMLTGDTLKRTYTLSTGGTANVLVTRLPGPFYWVASEGQAGASRVDLSSRRVFGSLLRLDTPEIGFLGALTGRGNVTVGGTALISGYDGPPAGWTGCPAGASVAGVALGDTTAAGLKINGCSGSACVVGIPSYLQTPVAQDTSTYFNYGSSNYSLLAASATKVIPGGTTLAGVTPVAIGAACQTALLTNWGDPSRTAPAGPCTRYYPTIHALGNLHITGSKGQGLLLVDGDLQISGGFYWVGMIVVRGTLRTTGAGAGIIGAVMAANVKLDDDITVTGNSYIRYSSCRVLNALQATAMLTPVKERAWVEVF